MEASSLRPPVAPSRRRSSSPAKRAGVQLRVETTPAASTTNPLPFSPTHLSPSTCDHSVTAPVSFSIFQSPFVPGAAASSPLATRHPGSPVTSTLGVESLNLLSDDLSRTSSPSPRPSLPAIHTSFPRSVSNRSLLASGAVESVTTITTTPASSALKRSKQLSSWLPAHPTSPLSSSASHTTYLSSAVSDVQAHHSPHRRRVGTPFAERAYTASSLGHADDASSVESALDEVPSPSDPGCWDESATRFLALDQIGLATATQYSDFTQQQQQDDLDEQQQTQPRRNSNSSSSSGSRRRRRRRRTSLLTPMQLWTRLDEQTSSNEVNGLTETRRASSAGRDQDLPSKAPPRNAKPSSPSSSSPFLTSPTPNHNSLLIIDLRTQQQFHALRLRNSIHVDHHHDTPPATSSTTLQWLESSCSTSMSKRRLSHIVEAAALLVTAPSPVPLISAPSLTEVSALPLSMQQQQRTAATERYFWETTDVLLVTDDAPDMLSSSSSGSGNESEDGNARMHDATRPRTSTVHTAHVTKDVTRVLDRLRSPVLLSEEAEVQLDSSHSGGALYVLQGGFEAVRSSPPFAPWLCSGFDGELMDSPIRTRRARVAHSPVTSSSRLRSPTDHSPRSPWSARSNVMRPTTNIDVGAANRTQLPIQLVTHSDDDGDDDGDADMPPPPRFLGTLGTATLPPPPIPTLHARGATTGPRRPMLARLDTSEHIKTLGVPSERRLSATSPRLRVQTDVLRVTAPLRSAVDTAAAERPSGSAIMPDVGMTSSSPVQLFDSTSSWPRGSATSLSASPKAIEADLPAASARATPSPFTFSTRVSPLETTGHASSSLAFSPSVRRGSEPPSTGLSPTLGHRSSLLREPQTPTTRSLSYSSASALEVDFSVSEILPGWLYLGPDIATTREALHLTQTLGVRRILNCAAEIEEGGGRHLNLHRGGNGVERYSKIPLQDHVEAKGVQKFIEDACAFLDDARLHSTPVYVHCKAGKSRSVLVVMAYLIHHLGWPLQRSYAHVDRRRAVSPNIGFVAELMRFEELRLGPSKARGMGGLDHAHNDEEQLHESSRRERNPHARDSFPPLLPAFSTANLPDSPSSPSLTRGTSPNATLEAPSGKSPLKTFAFEQRGTDGRYRTRKPPADAILLTPNRRATMAALGSQHHTFAQLMTQEPQVNDSDLHLDLDARMEAEVAQAQRTL